MAVPSEKDVVQDRHPFEDPAGLEGASQAQGGDLVGGQGVKGLVLEDRMLPSSKWLETAQTQLKRVVFPAPLGPMRPTISPLRM